MNSFECEKEPLILDAIRLNRWDDELSRHTKSCEACADAALAARFLQQVSSEEMPRSPLPDAGLAWRKAQLRARCRDLERATRPIDCAQTAALLCAMFCLAALCIGQWQAVYEWVVSLALPGLPKPALLWEFVLNLRQSPNYILIAAASTLITLFASLACFAWSRD